MSAPSSREPVTSGAKLPLGVWRRVPMDWAYRIEVEGYGSIAGVGFSTKAEAREAMVRAREEALSNE